MEAGVISPAALSQPERPLGWLYAAIRKDELALHRGSLNKAPRVGRGGQQAAFGERADRWRTAQLAVRRQPPGRSPPARACHEPLDDGEIAVSGSAARVNRFRRSSPPWRTRQRSACPAPIRVLG